MDKRRRVLILGSTGSIGCQTLDVIHRHSDELEVVGLAAGHRVAELLAQAVEFEVTDVALGDASLKGSSQSTDLGTYCHEGGGHLRYGEEGSLALIEDTDPDIVVNSLVGAAGLAASYATLKAGKVLALANKESLVVGGDLLMPLVHGLDASYPRFGEAAPFSPEGYLMPIDSEHGAIFQCLLGESLAEVSRLWVTASGGPFRGRRPEELKEVDAAAALAHPTWSMGPKITIDSSTLMNKGLEVIEAHHLFDMPYDRIEVVVQPQSAVHSMVEFEDGSVKAHLGTTDMRIPIQFALSYPKRWPSPVEPLDFRQLGTLGFEAPDMDTFKCLSLAFAAGERGGTLPCAMNAANEVAVARFLAGRCGFLAIADCVEQVMEHHGVEPVESLDQLKEIDRAARRLAEAFLEGRS